jgi:hypothetical protein
MGENLNQKLANFSTTKLVSRDNEDYKVVY